MRHALPSERYSSRDTLERCPCAARPNRPPLPKLIVLLLRLLLLLLLLLLRLLLRLLLLLLLRLLLLLGNERCQKPIIIGLGWNPICKHIWGKMKK